MVVWTHTWNTHCPLPCYWIRYSRMGRILASAHSRQMGSDTRCSWALHFLRRTRYVRGVDPKDTWRMMPAAQCWVCTCQDHIWCISRCLDWWIHWCLDPCIQRCTHICQSRKMGWGCQNWYGICYTCSLLSQAATYMSLWDIPDRHHCCYWIPWTGCRIRTVWQGQSRIFLQGSKTKWTLQCLPTEITNKNMQRFNLQLQASGTWSDHIV